MIDFFQIFSKISLDLAVSSSSLQKAGKGKKKLGKRVQGAKKLARVSKTGLVTLLISKQTIEIFHRQKNAGN